MPVLLDDVDYNLFIGKRPRQERYSLPLNPSGFDVVTDATVAGDRMVVASADGFAFFETFWDLGNLNDGAYFRLRQVNPPVVLMKKSPPSSRIDRAVLLGNPMSENYHHWVINCLPRLRMLDGFPEFSDWPLLVQGPLSGFQRNSLAAVGVLTKVKLFDGGMWEVGELAIPANGVFAPTEMRWLRKQMLAGMGTRRGNPRRIYISRADAGNRRVSNEPEVIACLARHGFESLVLSKMPLREQVQAFADAQVVAGPHGAGLTNIIFGGDDLKVLELHPADEVNYCFWLTASGMGQKYGFLSGAVTSPQRDMAIDVARLDAIVRKLVSD